MLLFVRVKDAQQRLALATLRAELEVIERRPCHDALGAALHVFDRNVCEVLGEVVIYLVLILDDSRWNTCGKNRIDDALTKITAASFFF